MSAAILKGRTLRAYTDGLGRLSAALGESAEIIASGGAASGAARPDSEDTGRRAGTPPALRAGDTDAETLTMDDHLVLHPEDRPCPWCCPPGWLPEECPRCLGDQRMGVVCPRCNGEGEGIDGWDCSPGCRCGRLVGEEAPR